MFSLPRRSMIARPLVRFCAVAAIAAFTAGAESRCSASFGDPFDNAEDGSGNGDSFVTTLRLRNAAGTEIYQFARGETITFELTVRNRATGARTVHLASTQSNEFLVYEDDEETPIWFMSQGLAFATVVTPVEFAAGETKVMSYTWDMELEDGTRLGAGTYDARGLMTAVGVSTDPSAPHELRSVLRSFRVN